MERLCRTGGEQVTLNSVKLQIYREDSKRKVEMLMKILKVVEAFI
jgi:hypothetical protein